MTSQDKIKKEIDALILSQEFNKARIYCNRIADSVIDDQYITKKLEQLDIISGNQEITEKYLREQINNTADQIENQLFLVKALIQSGNYSLAETINNFILNADPSNLESRYYNSIININLKTQENNNILELIKLAIKNKYIPAQKSLVLIRYKEKNIMGIIQMLWLIIGTNPSINNILFVVSILDIYLLIPILIIIILAVMIFYTGEKYYIIITLLLLFSIYNIIIIIGNRMKNYINKSMSDLRIGLAIFLIAFAMITSISRFWAEVMEKINFIK